MGPQRLNGNGENTDKPHKIKWFLPVAASLEDSRLTLVLRSSGTGTAHHTRSCPPPRMLWHERVPFSNRPAPGRQSARSQIVQSGEGLQKPHTKVSIPTSPETGK